MLEGPPDGERGGGDRNLDRCRGVGVIVCQGEADHACHGQREAGTPNEAAHENTVLSSVTQVGGDALAILVGGLVVE